ncbi:uncharacterized protein PFL1_00186 [Pseudozyma flocculosa PF-1]|uniref:Cytochrome c oxidase assembly protein COX20, mitochondrial n=1 Tax=Pseudozyma flocculosa TaxID=84751 RepID=A0A5C3EVC5_9BASI|nr:uncharacterized protein PFL1_00186 [Pseudozyma flocculosa PF-1]EPQ31988.1 hypothetical protein PFL1_00186 [Pseudozyma flocculosa PF-1]SPO35089.1 uncharacterized protein PSFLO_00560 [Pseudozyma flocculosa]
MSRLHEAPPSSSADAAHGDKAEATKVRAALSMLDPIRDFTRIGSIPCARSSLLMGMASAAGVAGISLIAGRGMRRGLNWGVGSFCFVSLASWETCRRSRKAEQVRMKTVIESYSRGGKKNATNIAEHATSPSSES